MFSKIRQIIGLETDEEKMFRYNELQKEFNEVSTNLDNLADTFLLEKSLYEKRIKSEDNYVIQQRITDRWRNFVELHKADIRKCKKQYDLLSKTISDIEKSLDGKINDFKLFKTLKKSYKSGLLGLVDYNESLKRLTKEKVTKYADFLLFNENGELLLLKRSTWEDDHQGAWVIPGGHVDLGEDFESAAVRELWEESGFHPNEVKNVGNYVDDKVHIEYYQGTVNTKEQSPLLDVNESRDYKWICLEDIDDYNMIFNMKDNVKKILNLKSEKINIRKSSDFSLEEVSGEDKGNILNEKLNALYKSFVEELNKSNKKYEFLIEKGFTEEAKIIAEDIEKAKKDISKLNKIKKLIYRDGKLVYGTYYVKTGEEIEDKAKISSAGKINLDVEQYKIYDVEYKKKGKKSKITGVVSGFCYSNKDNLNCFVITDHNGEKHWLSSNNVLSINKSNVTSPEEVEEEKYRVIQNLGGSTGAQLVVDKYGNRYVKKTGNSKEHIQAEQEALRLYRILGVRVPNIHEWDEVNDILYTEYIDGAVSINPDSLHDRKKISENFGVDALLANWDVVGLSYDNILYNINGHYRVDVGGCLDRRAQGQPKEFGPEVKEIETLLDPNINPQSAKMFEGVDVQEAIKDTIQKYENNSFEINISPYIRDEIKQTLNKRIQYLKTLVKVESTEEELEKLNYKGVLYDVSKDYYDEEIVEFYDRLNQDLKIDEKDLKELQNSNLFKTEDDSRKKLLSRLGFSNYQKGNKILIDKALENGVTWRELLALNEYTQSSVIINTLVTSYIKNSVTGNLNFDNNKNLQSQEVNTSIYLQEVLNSFIEAAKSINFAKDSGKSASEANQTKLENAKQNYEKLKQVTSEIIGGKLNIPKEVKQNVINLHSVYASVLDALNNDEKTPIISNPGYSGGVVNYKEKSKTPSNKIEVNGFGGKSYHVSFTKLICNALRKLEDVKDKSFYVEGLFNRGINTNSYGYDFNKEHSTPNQYVMHTWGSSSSWQSEGFVPSKDTHLKIIGRGVHIDSISEYSGPKESEVLLRPFSMYKTISFRDKNEDGKKEVILMKVI